MQLDVIKAAHDAALRRTALAMQRFQAARQALYRAMEVVAMARWAEQSLRLQLIGYGGVGRAA